MNDNYNNLPAIVSNNPIVEAMPVSADNLVRQVNSIQEAMKKVMQPDVHYGKIPGCGDKPTLLKPGAEKLGLMFRLGASFNVRETELPSGHREYSIVCTLTHIPSGQMVGQGVGSCSTMESKYRYAGSETELTSIEVPKEFWDSRSSEVLAQAVGGGIPASKLSTQKVDNKWFIAIKGEKKERKDMADVYNTCLKMGKKRAHVDAIITATAAGDIFTQDVEDMDIPAPVSRSANQATSQASHAPEVEVVKEAPKKAPPAQPAPSSSGKKFVYNIPFKAKGFDMNEVRSRLKAAKYRFDMETKHWTGSTEMKGLEEFLVGAPSAPAAQETSGDEPPPFPESAIPESWGDDQDIPF
jgi:hypothetical protein